MRFPNFMKDNIGMLKGRYLILCSLVASIIVMGAILSVVEWQRKHECHVVAQQYKRHTSYTFFGGGCYVETGLGVSVKLEQFKAFEQAH